MKKSIDESELESLLSDSYSVIPSKYRKRINKIKWIRRGTLRKITKIMNQPIEGQDYEDTVTCRLAAAYLLNGYWKIKLFHWIKWRLMWDKYSEEELLAICNEAKKKVQVKPYYENMILQTGLKDTLQQMTRKEVEVTLRELPSAQKG